LTASAKKKMGKNGKKWQKSGSKYKEKKGKAS